MGSLQAAENQSFVGFLKVNPSLDVGSAAPSSLGSERSNISVGAIAAIVVFAVVASLVLVGLLFCFIARRRRQGFKKHLTDSEDSEEDVFNSIPGLPARFSYTELQVITENFTRKLGKGGFGAVYLGSLPDGTKVAVKQLESVGQGDKEFRSEVAIMASIHHYNLLHLKGFCAQRAHRLLVYEFMENGSLDQWLFKRLSANNDREEKTNTSLSWDLRAKIVLGTARGLAYLHDDCRERILHLDIKPQNILLDKEFVPKVADFGLSRPMERDKSVVVTRVRGTPGYLAPEWIKQAGSIDVKCDVFSFGMLMLEVVSGRKNSDHRVKPPEQIYYPGWAYQQIVSSSAHYEGLSIADELTDAKLESEKERAQLMNVITTAFLCIVDKPESRPSMAKVVKMLEAGEYEEPFKASRILQQHEPQLVFVLMSEPQSRLSGDPASNSESSQNTRSSNYSVVRSLSSANTVQSGR